VTTLFKALDKMVTARYVLRPCRFFGSDRYCIQMTVSTHYRISSSVAHGTTRAQEETTKIGRPRLQNFDHDEVDLCDNPRVESWAL
jgi:hypothetical protein